MKAWFIYVVSYYDPEYVTKTVGVWVNNDKDGVDILKKRYGEKVASMLVDIYGVKKKYNIAADEYLHDGMTGTDRMIASGMLRVAAEFAK